MSDVDDRIFQFLNNNNKEALCISVKWGVGKTYKWNSLLASAAHDKIVSLKKYSYVSLFGVESLSELKYSIFENGLPIDVIGKRGDYTTFDTAMKNLEPLVRKGAGIAQLLPVLGKNVTSFAPAFFLTVRDQIICLDDIERKSRKLDINDVLGLVSFLKEQRGCKVVLLLNDGVLNEDDQKSLNKYAEKIFDSWIRFSPSPQDSAIASGIAGRPYGKELSETCEKLGIVNIRVLEKIANLVRDTSDILSEFEPRVSIQAAQSLAVLGWSVYEPDMAPSLEYLLHKRGRSIFGLGEEEKISENEGFWNVLLDNIGFTTPDKFDLTLLESVQNGFFNKERVQTAARDLNQSVRSDVASNQMHAAWQDFNSSFSGDQNAIVEQLYKSYSDNMEYVNIGNLHSLIVLLKDLSYFAEATNLIGCYVESGKANKRGLDLSSYPWRSDITDQELIDALNDAMASVKVTTNNIELMIGFASFKGVSQENTEYIASLNVDTYYEIFKGSTGDDNRNAVKGCLEFSHIGGASPAMIQISLKAKEALRRIGMESRLNARRIQAYGVDLNINYYPPV